MKFPFTQALLISVDKAFLTNIAINEQVALQVYLQLKQSVCSPGQAFMVAGS